MLRTASLIVALIVLDVIFDGVKATDDNQQSFVTEPPDQYATQGEHVTLPCRVKNKKGALQWTRDGFGLGIDRNLTGFHRYNMMGMSGSDEEGMLA